MSAIPQSESGWHAGFLAMLPAVRTHAEIQFRRLPAARKEEAIQEAIAAACLNYQLAAVQGRLHVVHPSTLADFAVRHVRTGRHVGGKQNAAQDVLSPVAKERHGVRVCSYSSVQFRHGINGWEDVVLADRKAAIPDVAAFRIDFRNWLRSLTRRDRKIIAAFVAGEGTFVVAGRFGLSFGRVSQLRRRYEQLWQAFQGDGTAEERAA